MLKPADFLVLGEVSMLGRHQTQGWLPFMVCALVLSAGACSKKAADPAPATDAAASSGLAAPAEVASQAPSAQNMQEAKALYAQRCTMCHGLAGHGDGPAAGGLKPRPRDYRDMAWQQATDDKEIAMAIVGGGPAVGKSLMMPANPDLKDRPEVVAGLVRLVRSFGKS